MSQLPGVRDARIDAARFLAIVFVVVGHVAAVGSFGQSLTAATTTFVVAFNMQLFVFISGYVLWGREGSSPRTFLSRKALALLVPYYSWLILGLLRDRVPLGNWAAEIALASVNAGTRRLWFLYVLFVFYVLFVLVRMLSKRDWALVVAVVPVTALMFAPQVGVFEHENIGRLFIYFVAGYLVAKHRSRLPKATPMTLVAAASAFALLLFLAWPAAGVAGGTWASVRVGGGVLASVLAKAVRIAAAFAAIATVASVCAVLPSPIVALLGFAGRRTLGIYCVHGLLLFLTFGTGLAGLVVSTALVLVVALGVTILLERTAVTRAIFLGRFPSRRGGSFDGVARDAA